LKNTLHGSKGFTGASAGAENARIRRAHTNETTRVGAHWSTDGGLQECGSMEETRSEARELARDMETDREV
jgi:hypothetical protein